MPNPEPPSGPPFDPASAGWDWVTVTVHRLATGQVVTRAADHEERLVLVLEGSAAVTAGDLVLDRIGSRQSVFDGPAAPVVLVAPGDAIRLEALTDAMVVVAAAPGGDTPVSAEDGAAPAAGASASTDERVKQRSRIWYDSRTAAVTPANEPR